MVSSACCADSQGSELLYFSLPVLREPKCKLRTPILSWTFKLHLLETWYISRFWYDPPRKEAVGDSSLQASELPHAAKSLTPGTCSMTLGVQILDVGIDAHGLATKPFDSQHASINHWVNNWFVPSIHSRDGGINSNSLLRTCVILDGIIPSPRFLLTIFKSPYQISIL